MRAIEKKVGNERPWRARREKMARGGGLGGGVPGREVTKRSGLKVGVLGVLVVLLVQVMLLGVLGAAVFAEEGDAGGGGASRFSMSPMSEKIVLDPGESYTGSFLIRASAEMTAPFYYRVYVQSYFRDENNNVIFENVGGMSQAVDWITLGTPERGELQPGEEATIQFMIDVPQNAPAGGQYAAITVGTDSSAGGGSGGAIKIQETVAIGHTVYMEITGNTVRQGEMTDVKVPSFLLSSNVVGLATIKNTGNVHGTATYTMQVFPIFSEEEVYTNEEYPSTRTILPGRAVTNETVWGDTPWIGIFNVRYAVSFEGVEEVVSKMVVVCPIWLLLLVMLAIILLASWLGARNWARRGVGRGAGKLRRSTIDFDVPPSIGSH